MFNDILKGNLTPELISRMNLTFPNVDTLQNVEKLVFAIVKLYEEIDELMKDVYSGKESLQFEIEMACQQNTSQVLKMVARSATDDNYYNLDIYSLIDEIFRDLDDLVSKQIHIKSELDSRELLNSRVSEKVSFTRKMMNKKSIDCGVAGLSSMIKMAVHRLVPKYTNPDCPVFDFLSFEDNLKASIRHSLQSPGLCHDKFVYFFLNDRLLYPSDFFKVVLATFDTDTKLTLTNFWYFDPLYDWKVDEQIRLIDQDYLLENYPLTTLEFNEKDEQDIEVKFDGDLEQYNIQSKVLMLIFSTIYRRIQADKYPIMNFNSLPKNKIGAPQVIITPENLTEFFAFLKHTPKVVNTIGESKWLGSAVKQIQDHRYQLPHYSSSIDPVNKYEIHNSLLDIYGKDKVSSSMFPHSFAETQ